VAIEVVKVCVSYALQGADCDTFEDVIFGARSFQKYEAYSIAAATPRYFLETLKAMIG